MKNNAIQIFDELLGKTKDYTANTVLELINRLAGDCHNSNRARTGEPAGAGISEFEQYLAYPDVQDVLLFAVNIQRMRSYTGKRGFRHVSKTALMLMRHQNQSVSESQGVAVAVEPPSPPRHAIKREREREKSFGPTSLR